jgi:hypothetical protein
MGDILRKTCYFVFPRLGCVVLSVVQIASVLAVRFRKSAKSRILMFLVSPHEKSELFAIDFASWHKILHCLQKAGVALFPWVDIGDKIGGVVRNVVRFPTYFKCSRAGHRHFVGRRFFVVAFDRQSFLQRNGLAISSVVKALNGQNGKLL